MSINIAYVSTSLVAMFLSTIPSQAQNLEYPEGYKLVQYETGWIKGSDQTTQCASFIAKNHPGVQWKIIESGESQKFENELLRTNSRYNYWCKLLIKQK